MRKDFSDYRFKIKLDDKLTIKENCELYGIKYQAFTRYMREGIVLETVYKYNLFNIIDYSELPDWYYEIKEREKEWEEE